MSAQDHTHNEQDAPSISDPTSSAQLSPSSAITGPVPSQSDHARAITPSVSSSLENISPRPQADSLPTTLMSAQLELAKYRGIAEAQAKEIAFLRKIIASLVRRITAGSDGDDVCSAHQTPDSLRDCKEQSNREAAELNHLNHVEMEKEKMAIENEAKAKAEPPVNRDQERTTLKSVIIKYINHVYERVFKVDSQQPTVRDLDATTDHRPLWLTAAEDEIPTDDESSGSAHDWFLGWLNESD